MIVFLILFSVFLYVSVFSPAGEKYPIPSLYNRFMVQPSPTTGLSHSFGAMVRGDIRLAKEWNSYGPRIFLFFLFEMILRVAVFGLILKSKIPVKIISAADISQAVVLFVVSYGKLLLFWHYL